MPLHKIPVYNESGEAHEFDVSTFKSSQSDVQSFDFVDRLITEIEVRASDRQISLTANPDSVSFNGNVLAIKFGDLSLPRGCQYIATILIYEFGNPEPIVISGAYKYSRIVLVSI